MGTVVPEKRSYKPFIHVVIMMSLMLFCTLYSSGWINYTIRNGNLRYFLWVLF